MQAAASTMRAASHRGTAVATKSWRTHFRGATWEGFVRCCGVGVTMRRLSAWGRPEWLGPQQSTTSLDASVTAFLANRGNDPVRSLSNAPMSDEQSALSSILSALIYMALGRGGPRAIPVQEGLKAATQFDAGTTGPREAALAVTLSIWARGDLRGAASVLEGLLLHEPTDAFALRLLHELYLAIGDKTNLRDSVARVMPRWEPEMLDYPRVCGMYAYALQETGAYGQAEDVAMRTLNMDPDDVMSLHTMLHVFDAQGRRNEGIRFLREFSDHWQDCCWLSVHFHAHYAVFSLEDTDMDMAFRRFDAEIGPMRDELRHLIDAAQMLWRFELCGFDVDNRWAPVAEGLTRLQDDRAYPMANVATAMSLAASGDESGARLHVERAFGESAPEAVDKMPPANLSYPDVHFGSPERSRGPLWHRATVSAVAEPLASGLIAYRCGDYETATTLLASAKGVTHVLGGSDAEHDIFTQTLTHAATQSNQLPLALALLSERISQRPASSLAWNHYSAVLAAMGMEDASFEARERAYSLGLGQGGTHSN